jgi:hypothetical protein
MTFIWQQNLKYDIQKHDHQKKKISNLEFIKIQNTYAQNTAKKVKRQTPTIIYCKSYM